MVKEVNLNKMLEDATDDFTTGFMCSETVLDVLNRHYDLGLDSRVIALATGFPYGHGNGGNICGAVAGATMALGRIFGRTEKGAPTATCLKVVRDLNDDIIKKYGTTICPEIIKDFQFADPERKTHCTELVHDVIKAFSKIVERECDVKVNA